MVGRGQGHADDGEGQALPDRRGRRPVVGEGWLFVHVPKTGGTSIREALRDAFGPGYFGAATSRNAHAPARIHRSALGPGRWDALFTFACVRNPYDRLVSAWAWARRFGGLQSGDFGGWVREGCPLHPRLRVVRGRGSVLWVTDPQCEWLTDENGGLLVAGLLRFEHLADDWRGVAARIGASPRLGRLNASDRGARHDDYYDAEARALARERYRRDFELLGYEP